MAWSLSLSKFAKSICQLSSRQISRNQASLYLVVLHTSECKGRRTTGMQHSFREAKPAPTFSRVAGSGSNILQRDSGMLRIVRTARQYMIARVGNMACQIWRKHVAMGTVLYAHNAIHSLRLWRSSEPNAMAAKTGEVTGVTNRRKTSGLDSPGGAAAPRDSDPQYFIIQAITR